jgi:hypothetical protein
VHCTQVAIEVALVADEAVPARHAVLWGDQVSIIDKTLMHNFGP